MKRSASSRRMNVSSSTPSGKSGESVVVVDGVDDHAAWLWNLQGPAYTDVAGGVVDAAARSRRRSETPIAAIQTKKPMKQTPVMPSIASV